MKKKLIKILAFFAKKIIKKYQPKIIGITGSVGKTSIKESLNFVLSKKFKVRASIKNYNNEFGLPLSIIGRESAGKNIFSWIKIFFYASTLLIFKDQDYPEILVLEMGIDREGDMDYLLSIVKPDIGIISNISHSHIEYFGSLEKIKKEKIKLVKNLKKDSLAILNFDNKYLKGLDRDIKCKTIYYGLEPGADLLAKDINFILPRDLSGDSFYGLNYKLDYKGSVLPINLSKMISHPFIYSSLAAIAVADYLGLNLIDIAKILNEMPTIAGRMNIIKGVKNSLIIDDTYNSSPESSLSALDALSKTQLDKANKIVVLGDMLELGHYSEDGHALVGKKVASSGVDILFLIGERSRDIGRSAIKAGFNKNNIFTFARASDAIESIKNKISFGDLILVKASQGLRLEKIVKDIMLEPEKAKDLLVRQSQEWN